jgi:uncharacterized protein YoxC
MIVWPLPYWWDFPFPSMDTNDYYFNSYTNEQRFKKIAEDICLLRKLYNTLVDAINDHETRIAALEEKVRIIEGQITDLYSKYNALVSQINTLNNRVDAIESQIDTINQQITDLTNRLDQLIADLPGMVQTIINNYLDSQDFVDKVTNIVNQLIANKMDKVPTAVENNIATFNNAGQVKDSGTKITTVISAFGQGDNYSVPTELAVSRAIIIPTTEANLDNLTNPGRYVSDTAWTVTVDSVTYSSSEIFVEFPTTISGNVNRSQWGYFYAGNGSEPILLARKSGSAWKVISHEYIQSTEELAQSVSAANPTALVYVPEV